MAMSSMETGMCRSGGGGGGSSGSTAGDELKTQFMTREGTYRLMTLSEYSRPNRVGYANNAQGGSGGGVPVRVSFVNVPAPEGPNTDSSQSESGGHNVERITFNFGREIFVYPYRGVKKAADLTKPIDKRIYKGTCPTCHDFGPVTDQADIIPLLVGFSGGQIQLIDPIRKELSKLYNEERLIEKSRVTCIKWVPGSTHNFLVSYASGNMYVYNHELLFSTTLPVYQTFKNGPGYAIYTCKTKTTRNPLYKWTIGTDQQTSIASSNGSNSSGGNAGNAGVVGCGVAINEFAFSPCGHFLCVVSADGYLRVFNYDAMELVGTARSYFGGLLCCCWSPDGKYIVVGGEDDLVTVYSMAEKRIVVRGQGHKSWVSVVAFDEYNLSYGDLPDGLDFSGSDEEGPTAEDGHHNGTTSNGNSTFNHSGSVRRQHHRRRACSEVNGASGAMSNDPVGPSNSNVTCYRFGSVGQDTLICLWDITEEALTRASREASGICLSPLNATGGFGKIHHNSSHQACNATPSDSATQQYGHNNSVSSGSGSTSNHVKMSNSNSVTSKDSGINTDTGVSGGGSSTSSATTTASAVSSSGGGGRSLSHRLASFTLGGDKHRGDKEERSSGRGLRGNFSLGRSSKDKDQAHNDKHGGSVSSLLSSSKSANSNYQNNSTAHSNAAGQQTLSEGLENGECVRLGSVQCPRIHDVPIIEPLVVKKIAHERLTALVFREECLVTACQDGYVCTWARPGRVVSNANPSANLTCPTSPQPGGAGTVV